MVEEYVERIAGREDEVAGLAEQAKELTEQRSPILHVIQD